MDQDRIAAIQQGWESYHDVLIRAIAPLDDDQLALRAAPHLRSVRDIAAHIIGARTRWFAFQLGGEYAQFKSHADWDRPGAPPRSAAGLVEALRSTWNVMQQTVASWTPQDWQQTWPGEGDSEPELLTRPWSIWHLIEHDLYHGGEISLTLGAHGIAAIPL